MFYIPFILNILFSSVCAYFALFETQYITANFLPLPPFFIQFIGVGLFLFAGFIIFALLSQQKLFWCTVVMALDVLWVITIVPVAILLKDVFNPEGTKLIMIINLAVGVLAMLQYIALSSSMRRRNIRWPDIKQFKIFRKDR